METELSGAPYTEPCKVCGETETTKWINAKDLISRGMCHTCEYWQERVEKVGSQTQAIINGIVYHIASEDSTPTRFRGHGGQKFTIKFDDERIVTTTNLWYNGPIPQNFIDKLPDNAVFIESPDM